MDKDVITLVTLTTWKFISLQITTKAVFCRHVMLIGMKEVISKLIPRVAGFIILSLKGLRRDEISCGVYGHVYLFLYLFICEVGVCRK